MSELAMADENTPTLAKMDLEERIRTRINGATDSLAPYKRKVYSLRRLVAGDFSSALNEAPSARQDGIGQEEEWKLDNFYDFIITDFSDGHSNRLLQTVKQLLMQVAFTEPDIEFEGLASMEAIVNAGWAKQRLAPAPVGCGARDAMKLGLLDFLIGGFGWSYTCMKRGMPALDYCDTLDMRWDRHARTPSDMRWASCRFTLSLAEWISMFGLSAVAEEYGDDPANLDRRLPMEFYYDIDSRNGEGTFAVFKCCGDGVDGAPVMIGSNPAKYAFGGQTRPFIPYTPMYFMDLPSCKEPIGIVELMFPDQLAMWGIENYIRIAHERGKPFWEVPDGTFSVEEEKKFLDGDYGAAVKILKGSINAKQGLDVPNNVMQDLAYRERQFIANSGLNPYANGTPVAGIEYAAEVKEISGMSGLTVSYVAEDHAAWWRDSIRKLLAMGQYDDNPITIMVGQVPVQFGGLKPISRFLRPDADVVVAADKMAFRPRAQRIAEAARDLKVASEVAQWFPTAISKAYEKYLRATGEKDIAGWMQAPPPVQAPAGGMPDAGGMPAGAPMPGQGAPAEVAASTI